MAGFVSSTGFCWTTGGEGGFAITIAGFGSSGFCWATLGEGVFTITGAGIFSSSGFFWDTCGAGCYEIIGVDSIADIDGVLTNSGGLVIFSTSGAVGSSSLTNVSSDSSDDVPSKSTNGGFIGIYTLGNCAGAL